MPQRLTLASSDQICMFDRMLFILPRRGSIGLLNLVFGSFWCRNLRNFLVPCRDSRDSSAAMVLWMIGLGLGDEGDISVKGLKAVQRMLDM